MDRLLFTPEEAAELLAIGRSKMYELLAAGDVHSVRIGTCRRVPASALATFVEQLEQDAHPDRSIADRGQHEQANH